MATLISERGHFPVGGGKEISNHSHRSVRRVQRWELIGLPIHRVGDGEGGREVALAEELELGVKTTPMRMPEAMICDLKAEIQRLRAEVLL